MVSQHSFLAIILLIIEEKDISHNLNNIFMLVSYCFCMVQFRCDFSDVTQKGSFVAFLSVRSFSGDA
jgi:hypothetical protein